MTKKRAMEIVRYYTRKLGTYQISTYASSASFFIITAIFPLLIVVFSVVSFTAFSVEDLIEMLVELVPESLAPFVSQLSEAMMASNVTTLSLSLVVTLWTAAKSVLGLLNGLNVIAGVKDTRNFVSKRVVCMGYMLVLLAGILANLALRVFGQFVLGVLEQITPGLAMFYHVAMKQTGLTLFIVLGLVFTLIYTFFPDKKMKFVQQIPGAVCASLGWLIFTSIFTVYVNRYRFSTALFSGLTTMILAMLWLYFCMYILFIGEAINRFYPEVFWNIYVPAKKRREERAAKEEQE